MPHIPYFPPEFNDWKPAPPPFPPVPTFFVNPLTPEQKAALREEFGSWAGERTIGMLSPREPYKKAWAYARNMYETHLARTLAHIPPAPTKERERRERKPTIAEEVTQAVSKLTPGTEEALTQAMLHDIMTDIERKHRRPNVEEIQAYIKKILDGAKTAETKITAAEAKRIVDNALAMVDAELARRAPARRVRL